MTRRYLIRIFSIITAIYLVSCSESAHESNAITVSLEPLMNQTVKENQELTFNIKAFDPNGGIPILISANLPSNASFVDNKDNTGTFKWKPGFNTAGKYENIIFKALDPQDANKFDELNINIEVLSFNPTPVFDIDQINEVAVKPQQVITLTLKAIDEDGTFPKIVPVSPPLGSTFNDFGNGTAIFNWEPSYNDFGNHALTFTAIDSKDPGLTVNLIVNIIVLEFNPKPTFNQINTFIQETEGNHIQFTVSASDLDSSIPTLKDLTLPPNATFTVTGSTGVFDWTPSVDLLLSNKQTIEYDAKFRAFDSTVTDFINPDPLMYDEIAVRIKIVNKNNNPIVNVSPVEIERGATSTIDILSWADDPDGDTPLTFSLQQPIPNGVLISSNRIQFSAPTDQSGQILIKANISDGFGGITPVDISVAIKPWKIPYKIGTGRDFVFKVNTTGYGVAAWAAGYYSEFINDKWNQSNLSGSNWNDFSIDLNDNNQAVVVQTEDVVVSTHLRYSTLVGSVWAHSTQYLDSMIGGISPPYYYGSLPKVRINDNGNFLSSWLIAGSTTTTDTTYEVHYNIHNILSTSAPSTAINVPILNSLGNSTNLIKTKNVVSSIDNNNNYVILGDIVSSTSSNTKLSSTWGTDNINNRVTSGDAQAVSADVGLNGIGLLVWREIDSGDGLSHVFTQSLDSNGIITFGGKNAIDNGQGNVSNISTSISRDGLTAIAWAQESNAGSFDIWVYHTSLDKITTTAGVSTRLPSVSINNSGKIVVSWLSGSTVKAKLFSPDSGWSVENDLYQGNTVNWVKTAIDGNGRAHVLIENLLNNSYQIMATDYVVPTL